jgi:hypothetical protein
VDEAFLSAFSNKSKNEKVNKSEKICIEKKKVTSNKNVKKINCKSKPKQSSNALPVNSSKTKELVETTSNPNPTIHNVLPRGVLVPLVSNTSECSEFSLKSDVPPFKNIVSENDCSLMMNKGKMYIQSLEEINEELMKKLKKKESHKREKKKSKKNKCDNNNSSSDGDYSSSHSSSKSSSHHSKHHSSSHKHSHSKSSQKINLKNNPYSNSCLLSPPPSSEEVVDEDSNKKKKKLEVFI